MNSNRFFSLAGTLLLAGGLFVGSIGWVGAQQHGTTGMNGTGQHGPDMMGDMTGDMMGPMMGDMMGPMMDDMMAAGGDHAAMLSMMGTEHPEMLGTMAEALGLTADELQAELDAGRSMPQIAEAQGIELSELHQTMMAELGSTCR